VTLPCGEEDTQRHAAKEMQQCHAAKGMSNGAMRRKEMK
jgi:hypothetical protein